MMDHAAADLIGSNDDLLTEILLWLPVVSILRFKCVSKHWRSLLSDTSFTLRYDTRHFDKPALGLFTQRTVLSGRASFFPQNDMYVSFDAEDQTTPPFRNLDFFSDPNGINIMQSCNGLLLCCSHFGYSSDRKYYVFNPTTKQFVIIPSVPVGYEVNKTICFMGLAFHQRECVHYKLVCVLTLEDKPFVGKEVIQIQIYSSDTRQWKISIESLSTRDQISAGAKHGTGVYCNGSIHWALNDYDRSYIAYMYFKIDVEELHSLPLPVEAMSSKTRPRYLGESRGHLHLIVYDHVDKNLLPLKVYELLMDCSGWFVKYRVELDGLLQKVRSVWSAYLNLSPYISVIDVVRGEKHEDTFMVLQMHGQYLTYNVHAKSFKYIPKLKKLDTSPFFCSFPRYLQTLASF